MSDTHRRITSRSQKPYCSPLCKNTNSYLHNQLTLLIGSPKLEELLDDIVTKHVSHQTVGGRQNLLEKRTTLTKFGNINIKQSLHSVFQLDYSIRISRIVSGPTWKTSCFSAGAALSSFCCINLEPCWSWLNSTIWLVRSRSCRLG